MKKTSEEWQREHPDLLVHDPDGWDRKNLQYSWYEELITFKEYQSRLCNSTIFMKVPQEQQDRLSRVPDKIKDENGQYG